MFRLMAAVTHQNQPPRLETQRLLLRLPQSDDFSSYVDVRRRNQSRFQPVEPQWSRDALGKGGFMRRLRNARSLWQRRAGLAFFIFIKPHHTLIGGITASWLDTGRPGTAMVGYWLDGRYEGQGLMGDALRSVSTLVHQEHHIRRIEAACLPHNTRSMKLLHACGFQREGYCRSYLKINGVYEDHVLFARLHADPLRCE